MSKLEFEPLLVNNNERKKYSLSGFGFLLKESIIVKKGENGLAVKSAFSHVSFSQIRLCKSHDRVQEHVPNAAHRSSCFLNLCPELDIQLREGERN